MRREETITFESHKNDLSFLSNALFSRIEF